MLVCLFVYLFVCLFVCLPVYHEFRLEKWFNKMRINELSFISFADEVRESNSLYFSKLDLV